MKIMKRKTINKPNASSDNDYIYNPNEINFESKNRNKRNNSNKGSNIYEKNSNKHNTLTFKNEENSFNNFSKTNDINNLVNKKGYNDINPTQVDFHIIGNKKLNKKPELKHISSLNKLNTIDLFNLNNKNKSANGINRVNSLKNLKNNSYSNVYNDYNYNNSNNLIPLVIPLSESNIDNNNCSNTTNFTYLKKKQREGVIIRRKLYDMNFNNNRERFGFTSKVNKESTEKLNSNYNKNNTKNDNDLRNTKNKCYSASNIPSLSSTKNYTYNKLTKVFKGDCNIDYTKTNFSNNHRKYCKLCRNRSISHCKIEKNDNIDNNDDFKSIDLIFNQNITNCGLSSNNSYKINKKSNKRTKNNLIEKDNEYKLDCFEYSYNAIDNFNNNYSNDEENDKDNDNYTDDDCEDPEDTLYNHDFNNNKIENINDKYYLESNLGISQFSGNFIYNTNNSKTNQSYDSDMSKTIKSNKRICCLPRQTPIIITKNIILKRNNKTLKNKLNMIIKSIYNLIITNKANNNRRKDKNIWPSFANNNFFFVNNNNSINSNNNSINNNFSNKYIYNKLNYSNYNNSNKIAHDIMSSSADDDIFNSGTDKQNTNSVNNFTSYASYSKNKSNVKKNEEKKEIAKEENNKGIYSTDNLFNPSNTDGCLTNNILSNNYFDIQTNIDIMNENNTENYNNEQQVIQNPYSFSDSYINSNTNTNKTNMLYYKYLKQVNQNNNIRIEITQDIDSINTNTQDNHNINYSNTRLNDNKSNFYFLTTKKQSEKILTNGNKLSLINQLDSFEAEAEQESSPNRRKNINTKIHYTINCLIMDKYNNQYNYNSSSLNLSLNDNSGSFMNLINLKNEDFTITNIYDMSKRSCSEGKLLEYNNREKRDNKHDKIKLSGKTVFAVKNKNIKKNNEIIFHYKNHIKNIINEEDRIINSTLKENNNNNKEANQRQFVKNKTSSNKQNRNVSEKKLRIRSITIKENDNIKKTSNDKLDIMKSLSHDIRNIKTSNKDNKNNYYIRTDSRNLSFSFEKGNFYTSNSNKNENNNIISNGTIESNKSNNCSSSHRSLADYQKYINTNKDFDKNNSNNVIVNANNLEIKPNSSSKLINNINNKNCRSNTISIIDNSLNNLNGKKYLFQKQRSFTIFNTNKRNLNNNGNTLYSVSSLKKETKNEITILPDYLYLYDGVKAKCNQSNSNTNETNHYNDHNMPVYSKEKSLKIVNSESKIDYISDNKNNYELQLKLFTNSRLYTYFNTLLIQEKKNILFGILRLSLKYSTNKINQRNQNDTESFSFQNNNNNNTVNNTNNANNNNKIINISINKELIKKCNSITKIMKNKRKYIDTNVNSNINYSNSISSVINKSFRKVLLLFRRNQEYIRLTRNKKLLSLQLLALKGLYKLKLKKQKQNNKIILRNYITKWLHISLVLKKTWLLMITSITNFQKRYYFNRINQFSLLEMQKLLKLKRLFSHYNSKIIDLLRFKKLISFYKFNKLCKYIKVTEICENKDIEHRKNSEYVNKESNWIKISSYKDIEKKNNNAIDNNNCNHMLLTNYQFSFLKRAYRNNNVAQEKIEAHSINKNRNNNLSTTTANILNSIIIKTLDTNSNQNYDRIILHKTSSIIRTLKNIFSHFYKTKFLLILQSIKKIAIFNNFFSIMENSLKNFINRRVIEEKHLKIVGFRLLRKTNSIYCLHNMFIRLTRKIIISGLLCQRSYFFRVNILIKTNSFIMTFCYIFKKVAFRKIKERVIYNYLKFIEEQVVCCKRKLMNIAKLNPTINNFSSNEDNCFSEYKDVRYFTGDLVKDITGNVDYYFSCIRSIIDVNVSKINSISEIFFEIKSIFALFISFALNSIIKNSNDRKSKYMDDDINELFKIFLFNSSDKNNCEITNNKKMLSNNEVLVKLSKSRLLPKYFLPYNYSSVIINKIISVCINLMKLIEKCCLYNNNMTFDLKSSISFNQNNSKNDNNVVKNNYFDNSIITTRLLMCYDNKYKSSLRCCVNDNFTLKENKLTNLTNLIEASIIRKISHSEYSIIRNENNINSINIDNINSENSNNKNNEINTVVYRRKNNNNSSKIVNNKIMELSEIKINKKLDHKNITKNTASTIKERVKSNIPVILRKDINSKTEINNNNRNNNPKVFRYLIENTHINTANTMNQNNEIPMINDLTLQDNSKINNNNSSNTNNIINNRSKNIFKDEKKSPNKTIINNNININNINYNNNNNNEDNYVISKQNCHMM